VIDQHHRVRLELRTRVDGLDVQIEDGPERAIFLVADLAGELQGRVGVDRLGDLRDAHRTGHGVGIGVWMHQDCHVVVRR